MNNSDRLPLVAVALGFDLDRWQKLTAEDQEQETVKMQGFIEWAGGGWYVPPAQGDLFNLGWRKIMTPAYRNEPDVAQASATEQGFAGVPRYFGSLSEFQTADL